MPTPIYDPEYYLVGRKLIIIARNIEIQVTEGSGRHRTQRGVARGKGNHARCYIDIPAEVK